MKTYAFLSLSTAAAVLLGVPLIAGESTEHHKKIQEKACHAAGMMSLRDMMAHMHEMMGRMQGMTGDQHAMGQMGTQGSMGHMGIQGSMGHMAKGQASKGGERPGADFMSGMHSMAQGMSAMMNQMNTLMSDQQVMKDDNVKRSLQAMQKDMGTMMQSMDDMLDHLESAEEWNK